MQLRVVYALLLTTFLLSGCSGIGPARVNEDRIEYNLAIIDSWKRQILLNIVKIRYVEPIFFMDVGEVVTSYSMETGGSINASPTLYNNPSSISTLLQLGGKATYTDRPTITYRPLTGNDFFRGVMSPMPLRNLLASIESGASGKFLFKLGVRSINGLYNESFSTSGFKAADNKFTRVTELLALLQARNALHIVYSLAKSDMPNNLYLKFISCENDSDTAGFIAQLQALLKLDKGIDKYRIRFGSAYANNQTVMLQTYTLAQVLAFISERMELPEQDIAAYTVSSVGSANGKSQLFDRVMIRSSLQQPVNTFVQVKYRGKWFWVDDNDLVTKKVFSFIMLAFTMMDKEESNSALQLTVPTQ